VPVLAFQDRFVGGTDYLDGICYTDLTQPIMIGVDRYRRPFLCVVYHDIDTDAQVSTYVLTVFQRYTDSPFMWCRIGCDTQWILGEHNDTYMSMSLAAKTTLLRNLYRLLGGGDERVGWLGEG